ncbi:MAG TPA: hypothetical protein VEA41_16970, partial [Salinarimonas sp.]|nr:hypothetical protein [Salinarimonas sp.]
MIVSLGMRSASMPAFRSSGDVHSDPKQAVEMFSTIAEKMPGVAARVPASEFFRRVGVTPAAADEGVETLADILGGTTTPSAEAPSAEAPVDAVQSALNGAQIQSLVDVVQQVQAGTLNKPAAMAIIAAGFPSVPAELVERMVLSEAADEESELVGGEALEDGSTLSGVLLEVAKAVRAGEIDASSGVAIVRASFPQMSEAAIQAIVAPAPVPTLAPPPPPVAPAAQMAGAP